MKIHTIQDNLPTEWIESLVDFEQEFRYPLGPGKWFRISHGKEYLPFFQAMGPATLLVAEESGVVQGTIVYVKRNLQGRSPFGEVRDFSAYYLCDLKLRPSARRTPLLMRLIQTAQVQMESAGDRRYYCVVMDGTGRLPSDYSGRFGIPPMRRIGQLMIWRIATAGSCPAPSDVEMTNPMVLEKLRQEFALPGFYAEGGNRQLRSHLQPLPLIDRTGTAWGTLEDTRRGKKLYLENGDEMLSAHLSGWSWSTPEAGVNLLRQALALSHQAGFPAMFTALPLSRAAEMRSHLGGLELLDAPASIYGIGFDEPGEWWIDTAEI